MWTYNSNRLYVQKITKQASQIIPRLQPLSGGSVLQSFGYDSTIRNVEALVVGDTVNDALEALAKDGATAHALVSPEGSLGSWILKDYNSDRIPNVCQTIDPLQAEDVALYTVSMTLWRED
jgi:hypothetical protein